jgi:hypothetical protein
LPQKIENQQINITVNASVDQLLTDVLRHLMTERNTSQST